MARRPVSTRPVRIIRHGSGGFLGETNLLSGQTAFLTAVVTEPLRYIAVEREQLRTLLFEDSALSDLMLWVFMARREALQARDGVGIEIVGPHSSEATRTPSSSSRAATGCPSRGWTPTVPSMRRSSPRISGLAAAQVRPCACREGRSFGIPLPARFPGRWASGSTSTRR